MNRILAAAGLALVALSCATDGDAPPAAPPIAPAPAPPAVPAPAPPAPKPTADAAFRRVAADFLAGFLRRNPTNSTSIGDHSHDGEWPDVSAEGDAETRAFIATTRAALAAIPATELDPQNRIDAAILRNQLDAWSFELDELRSAEENPLFYTGLVGDGVDPLVTRSFAPHEERMKNLLARLRGVPRIVEIARKRLGKPPRVHTETAIEQGKGLRALCDKGLAADIAKVPALARDLTAAAQAAAAALGEFQTFLDKDLLPRSTGDFRIGRERFTKKLRFTLEDDVDPDAIAAGARALLATTQEEMFATAKELWPTVMAKGGGKAARADAKAAAKVGKAPPLPRSDTPAQRRAIVKQVLDALADDRPDNATIVKEARQLLDDATAFVGKHDLVRVPDEPCAVIEMPEYRRGVAIAYCDSSGPLEAKQETFFAISPTPADWSAKRALSFYREYNRSMLADLTVHEAMPGHYLQAMHANRFKSDVRAVFTSGPFVEGWAVYGEWLMDRYGFGGARVRLERQKMLLRLCTNAIIDHDIHAGTMTEKEALALMTGEGFQEEGEAVGKWKRARLTSAQLTTYYYGFTELLRLRQELEAKPGFTERSYHDRLLAAGAPAIRHTRARMLSASQISSIDSAVRDR